jgi:hypothetical protein
MAELRHWHGVCLTIRMRKKIARLFTIKTKFEAWLVIYAIALGAVERGRHYLEIYPGAGGWLLFFACTGVVFLAGGKLLDSVAPKPAIALGPYAGEPRRRLPFSRNRPRAHQRSSGSESQPLLRKD